MSTSQPSSECPIAAQARENPKAAAIATASGTLSYAELHERVTLLAEQLPASRGERVCFQPNNSIEFVTTYWALFRRGAIGVPISTRLNDEQAQLRVEQVNGRLLSDLSGETRTSDKQAVTTKLDLDQPATIIFSSGSTGQPKAVVHDLRAHLCSAEGSNTNLPLSIGDRWLLSLPTFHVGGLSILFRCALAGACVAIPETGASLSDSISNLDVTHLSIVPTQLMRILESKVDPSNLVAVLLGGSVLPERLVAEAYQSGFPIYATYGLTEMASQVTTTNGSRDQRDSGGSGGSVGHPLRHRSVILATDGEILVRGATLCRGYWRDGKIESVVDEIGWFHTKDVGKKNEDGTLSVTGRMDNMFISGGENIHPEEIEQCLLNMLGVRQAVVVGVPDAEFGHRPVAVVEVAAGNLEWFKLFRREDLFPDLPKFMVPDVIYPWPTDIEPLGIKPDRQRVREWVEQRRNAPPV